MDPAEAHKNRVVFYSMKGGVGRSTALGVCAWALAEQGRRVMVLDLDLESPGLSASLLPDDRQPKFGITDWLVEDLVENGDQVFEDMVATSELSRNGDIFVVPAHGADPGEYVAKLGRVWMPKMDDQGHRHSWPQRLKRLLEKLEKQWRPDVVLIDSRAGIDDVASACVTALGANLILLFAIDGDQTWSAYRVLFHHWNRSASADTIQSRLQMVAAMVPETDRVAYLDGFRERSWTIFSDDDIRSILGPHVPALSKVEVRQCYGEKANPDRYPDMSTFEGLLKNGAKPYDIWRAVLVRQVRDQVRDQNRLGGPTDSWQNSVAWVSDNPEFVARAFKEADDANSNSEKRILFVFDALDRTTSNWGDMDQIISGLLRLVLDLKSYRRFHGKVFLRENQYHDLASPRSFLAAIRAAAEDSSSRYLDHEFPLHYESIKRGVQQASEIRIAELSEGYLWAKTIMECLADLTVPCEFSKIEELWKKEFGDRPESRIFGSRLPSEHWEEGWSGIRHDLERLGIFHHMKNGRTNMPDLYRVGFGLGRRGGVRPVGRKTAAQ